MGRGGLRIDKDQRWDTRRSVLKMITLTGTAIVKLKMGQKYAEIWTAPKGSCGEEAPTKED